MFRRNNLKGIQLIGSFKSHRFSFRNVEIQFVAVFIIMLISIFIIYMLIHQKIRVLTFVFFITIGIIFIICNKTIGFYYILTYIFFMPFLRRWVLLHEKYVPIDILYLVPDILVLLFFTYIFLSNIDNFREILKFPEFKILFFLQIIMFLEIFNPLQKSLLAGFGGAKFLLIPSLFSYIVFIVNSKSLKKMKNYLLILGIISLLYAFFQLKVKYFSFEEMWIANIKEKYLSLLAIIGGNVRPFSFFSSVGEFGEFMGVLCVITLFFIRRYLKFLLLFLFLSGIIISGIRLGVYSFILTSIFGIIYLKSKNFKSFIKISLFIMIGWILMVNLLSVPSSLDPLSYQGRFLQGILDPLRKGSSLHPRLDAWKTILRRSFTEKPFGVGLGAATLASIKFRGFVSIADSTFFGMFAACGLIGGFLLFYLLFSIIWKSLRIIHTSQKTRVFFPLLLIISISIGQLLTQYFLGPIFWTAIGLWVKNFYEFDKIKKI